MVYFVVSLCSSTASDAFSSIGGIGLDDVARRASEMHALGFAPGAAEQPLENAGRYAYRRDGEFHGWNPKTVLSLQAAAQSVESCCRTYV